MNRNKVLKHLLRALMILGLTGVMAGSIAAYRQAEQGDIATMIFDIALTIINTINTVWLYFFAKERVELVQNERDNRIAQAYLKEMTPNEFDEMVQRLNNERNKSK
jgi:hypothetical protein